MSEARPDDPETQAPAFLDAAPPHWIARAGAALLIGAFAITVLLAVTVRVPETVTSPFVLVPIGGTDPVRAARGGVVTRVALRDAEPVEKGATLFTIRSSPARDRLDELATLEKELEGARQKIANAALEHSSARKGDEAERSKLGVRRDELAKIITHKRKQYALTQELVRRHELLREKGFSSRADSIRHELDASRVAAEIAEAELQRSEAALLVDKLGHEMAMRAARDAEIERRLAEEVAKAEIRSGTLRGELGSGSRGDLEVSAPCAGTVLRVRVKAPGAVVAEGDVLGEIACSGEGLEAELEVPPSRAGRLDPGQRVKLLYDAFPYQRHGVRYGTLRWLSPAATESSDRKSFRALVDLDDRAIAVGGSPRPLRPGMGGSARIVVGARSLGSYAFEPIRQLRESLATGPAR